MPRSGAALAIVDVLFAASGCGFTLPQIVAAFYRSSWNVPSAIAMARDPAIADFHVGALDGRPRDAVCGFFLTRVAGMGREGVIECRSINVLRVRRQMTRDGSRQILVGAVGYNRPPYGHCKVRGRIVDAGRRWSRPHIPHRRTNQVFAMCVSTA